MISKNMTIQNRSTLSKNESIFSSDDYIITPSTKLHLLTLEGKCIYLEGEGVCKIKSFKINKVAESCGSCIFGKYKTATVLSKIVIEPLNSNITKYIDRNSSNLKTLITNDIHNLLVNPNQQAQVYPQIAS